MSSLPAFSAAATSVGDAYLVSPGEVLGESGATLTFRHSFELQSGRDGGVLEASLDGGAWFDLLESAATVTAGGYNNSIGEAQLQVAWTDPDFQAAQAAIYYARVLEIPTPRWSTYDAATLGIAPRKDIPAFIQERAWTSPIWYTP